MAGSYRAAPAQTRSLTWRESTPAFKASAPLSSTPVGGDLWEGAFALPRGLYHFNLLVDGREWVVPKGVATVPDGLGGAVAVLLVR